MKRALVVSLAMTLAGCESFVDLGEQAECRANLPSCSTFDAGDPGDGSVDAGRVDAGGSDAGEQDSGVIDAGELDAGVADAGAADAGAVDAGELDAGGVDAGVVAVVPFDVAWAVREGVAANRLAYRSGLASMNGGLALWLVSAFTRQDTDGGRPAGYPGGYAVAVASNDGKYLQNDGGLGGRTTDVQLVYLESYVTSPNVAHGVASIAKSEVLIDGGALQYSDGGLVRAVDGGRLTFSNQNTTQEFDLDTGALTTRFVEINNPSTMLAAGRLWYRDELRQAHVTRGSSTQLVLRPSMSDMVRTFFGTSGCAAFPNDVATGHTDLADGGQEEALLTVSTCGGRGWVASYSPQVGSSELDLGIAGSVRMAIAREGTPGRAPVVALSLGTTVRVTRLDALGTAVAASVNLLTSGPVPQVEALTVDESDRPVVVLRVSPNMPFALNGAQTQSSSGLVVVGLAADLSVRWLAPVRVANGELLHASAALVTGGHLLLGVECEGPRVGSTICDANPSPALIRVGRGATWELP